MIEVRQLCKRLGTQEVLRGVDLSVSDGETLAVVGRSGCGKSVLLRHLVGLLKPSSGDVRIDGESIVGLDERRLAPIRRRVGILFQGGALFDSMNVFDNVAFPLREQGVREPATLRARVEETLETLRREGIRDAVFFPLVVFRGTGLYRHLLERFTPEEREQLRLNPWSEEYCLVNEEFPTVRELVDYADSLNRRVQEG